MAEKKWTKMQRCAIDTRDKTLLVSAAAGSGKTATLTERIIRSILDDKNPESIENMLVVTFTRAAAGELRDRIGAAIREELENRPGDPWLEHQLHMLPGAKISTIDSFCTDILRSGADYVGVQPGFRIPDEAETAIIGESILDGIFSEICDGRLAEVATPEQFESLSECLTNTDRQSDLAAIVDEVYESTLYNERGVDSLLPLVEEFNPERFTSVEQSGYGRYIMKRLDEMIAHHKAIFKDALGEIEARANPAYDKFILQIREALDFLGSLEAAGGYCVRRELLLSEPLSAKAEQYRDKTLPNTTKMRKDLKDDVAFFVTKLFAFREEDWRAAYEGIFAECSTLYRIIKKYDTLFREEKIRRGILEFSDILRLAYECLWKDGELTDIALSERAKYTSVYIDEYQDVNSLQNRIFEAVSTETNRFMVGDIKQSIYAFRSAKAEIFAELKREYPPIDAAAGSTRAAIFMSDNFRCDRGIINFVNTVFDKVFSLISDSIEYVTEDRLGCAKVYDGGKEPPLLEPQICLIDASGLASAYKAAQNKEINKNELSPILVAEKIRELLAGGKKNDGTPIQPEDIAIIMRKAKGRAALYKSALERLGIPAVVAEENKFFLNPECRLALCLLNSIDNPHKDIYLAGLMLSPLYGFTPDEMLRIKSSRGRTLYESLKNYVNSNTGYTRGEKFIEDLEKYRLLAEGMPTDKLIMRLYGETGLFALGANHGGRERLLMLYEYARSFEEGSFGGLYNFISYINGIATRKNSLDKREAPRAEREVSIITAHGSKGLEYPVVFFVGAEDGLVFRPSGEPPRFEYEEDFGIGMFARTPSGISLVRNATKQIVIDYRNRRAVEEEARILYVILTRAREQLYIVGAPASKLNGFLKDIEYYREHLDGYSIYEATNFIQLILGAAPFRVMEADEFLDEIPDELKFPNDDDSAARLDTFADEGTEALALSDEYDEELEKKLALRFSYVYPGAALADLPAKLSVSRLYPEVLDGADEGADYTALERSDKATLRFSGKGIRPEFTGAPERDSAAKRGIATHMLMQFCDLERLAEDGVDTELSRLVDEKFLSERDGMRVIKEEVELFRNSELLSEMRLARRLWREFRFNVKLPAAIFTADEERLAAIGDEELLVQGVIDCLYEDEAGGYHLVDYKTDRLTKAELADGELARQRLFRDHADQLGYYAEAVKRIFGKYPDTVSVYAMQLGRCVDVRK